MHIRPSLAICLVLALLGWAIAGDTSGPEPKGATSNTAPVQMGAYAQPSALPSPVAAGKVDRITTDGEGNLWARLRGTIATSLASGNVTVSNITTGNVAVSGLAAHDAAISGDPVIVGGYSQGSGTLPTITNGNGVATYLLTDRYGRLRSVSESASSGTVLNDSLGDWVQGSVAHDSPISTYKPLRIAGRAEDVLYTAVAEGDVADLATTSQGQARVILDANANAVGISNYCAPSHAGGGTEVTVKASAGLVKYLHVSNPNTTDVYLHLWDASNPTPGTTDPLVCYTVPGGTGASNRGVYDLVLPEPGITCATAITATVTTAANGSSAPGSAVTLNIGYK